MELGREYWVLCLLRPRPSPCDDWQSCCYAWLGVTLAYIINNCKKVQRFCEKQINLFQNNLFGAPQLRKLRERGVDPLEDTHVIEIDNCATSDGFASTVMRGCSPCLTRRRAQSGGHWVSTRGRRLTTPEMLKLQSMRPARLVVPPSVPESAFRAMIGNSMSVNIVEVLLAMLSRACPGVLDLALI